MTTLYIRLSMVFLAILFVFGALSLWIADHTARAYFIESTQQLNAPIAGYMAQSAELVVNNQIDTEALAELAERIMIINPSLELYLLDTLGNVIAQASNANRIAPMRVDLEPVIEFMSINAVSTKVVAVLGDNPLNPNEKRAFSAAPLRGDERVIGYVYAVLAGKKNENLLRSIRTSYSLQNLALMFAGIVVLASLGGGIIFFTLTRRLRSLTIAVKRWQQQMASAPLSTSMPSGLQARSVDEIDELTHAYQDMATELQAQYQSLDAKEKNRRELMANISHDLRTPLTTLQGYLETVLIKKDSLESGQVDRYLSIALNHGKRLGHLVEQLFELSKFDAGDVELQKERFSLLELAHDALQDIEMRAQERCVTLRVAASPTAGCSFDVNADISLVHRVLENLLDNALRYTADKGEVCIHLHSDDTDVMIKVSDTGSGISSDDTQRIFEPRFSSRLNNNVADQHAGLGLAIVDRIVSLHGSKISVDSKKGSGTVFSFHLDAATL